MPSKRYWLLKSEPDCFSIHDLAAAQKRTTGWDGVRNYQARNFMRDKMRVGDRVLFYHSGGKAPTVAGTAVIVREAYPDATAFDPDSDHFDPASSMDNPAWMMVDIELDEIFDEPVSLDVLRKTPGLEKMELLRKGSRLSVQPVTEPEFQIVLDVAHGRANASKATAKAQPAATRARAGSKRAISKR